jgi:Xaa-Pro aminopeptidase
MNARINKIIKKLKKQSLDGFILNSPANISYLSGFRSRDSYMLISAKGSFYLTDSRYFQEAKKYLRGISVIQPKTSVFEKISGLCKDLSLSCVGFEERHISFVEYSRIRKSLDDNIGLAPVYGIIEEERQIKNKEDLAKIRQAIDISMDAFRFIRDYIKPGAREIEIAGELERFIRYHGATTSSFDIIVGSGPNSSFPHHITSSRRIRKDEAVLIDMGVDYSGYKSDLTRVFFSGKINPLIRRIYDIVFKAQRSALAAVKPATVIGRIDSIARDYIGKMGYAGYFGHGLGHGVGLEVHEKPNINKRNEGRLKPGMVFTVEPAIYLPNKFGIRLEDMVLVTKKGSEVLSGSLDK